MIKKFLQRNRIETSLFFLLFITFGYFYQSGQHNESARFDLTRSIAEDGTVCIDKYAFNSADIVRVNGRLFSNKAPGLSFIGVPPFFLFGQLFRLFILPEWIVEDLLCYLTALFSVGLFSALCALCIFKLLRRISGDVTFAFWCTIAYALGTIAFPFSTVFFSHQFAAALVFISFYLIFSVREEVREGHKETRGVKRAGLRLFLAGLMGGFALTTEYPTIVLVGLITLYLFIGVRSLRGSIYYIMGLCIGGMFLVAYNLAAFHKIFYIPYEAYTQSAHSAFPGHKRGFVGMGMPSLGVLWRITFHPQRGLFYCNPALIGAIPGLILGIFIKRIRLEAIFIFLMAIGYFAFNSAYGNSIVYWGGAWSTGPRHIIPLLPFLSLPMFLFFRSRILRLLFYALAAVSIFFMFTTTAVDPRSPYEYANPVMDYHIANYVRCNHAIITNPIFNHRLITENSTAANLGKLIRLRPCLEFLPLYVFWAVMAFSITKRLRTEIKLPISNLQSSISNSNSPVSSEGSGENDEGVSVPYRGPEQRPWQMPRFSFHPRTYRFLSIMFVTVLFAIPLIHQAQQKHALMRGNGLVGRYYKGMGWKRKPQFVRKDRVIFFNWAKRLPITGQFSVEWDGFISIRKKGRHRFILESDDGSFLYINGRKIVDNGGYHGARMREGMVYLNTGKHQIKIKYFNYQFGGIIRLYWVPPGESQQMVPPGVLSSPSQGGRE